MAGTIEIRLNGEPYQLIQAMKVPDLLAQLDLPTQRVAIELNHDILPRTQWAETILREGDKLEIVHFVGGG